MSARNESAEALLAHYRQANDEDAFKTLYDRFSPELRVFIARHVEGRLAANVDDILQQVFLELHARRQRYPHGTRVRPLLYKIAERQCNMHLRQAEARKRDYRLTCYLEGNQDTSDPAADPARHELRMLVAELLDTLPSEEAEVLRLVKLEGHSVPSAAAKLGWTVTKAEWRLREAIRRLKEPCPTA
jgi:RNA polymerase sigma factor (sigma-70 family)